MAGDILALQTMVISSHEYLCVMVYSSPVEEDEDV
jgi:hypothetical protein